MDTYPLDGSPLFLCYANDVGARGRTLVTGFVAQFDAKKLKEGFRVLGDDLGDGGVLGG